MAREYSRQMDKIRKRLKREIARTEHRSQTQAEQRYTESLKRLLKSTYKVKGESAQEYESRTRPKMRAITGIVPYGRQDESVRSNAVFRNEIRLASRGNENTVIGESGRFKVSAFYAATRQIWQGIDPAKRNAAIQAFFGTPTLEDAFNLVMEMEPQRNALDAHRRRFEEDEWTSEQVEFYGASGESDVSYDYQSMLFVGLTR